MPWDHFQWEAWLELAPSYRDKLHDEVKDLLKNYTFGRTQTVICQDEFADPVWDKEKKYLSTNQAYWDGINDGYDYVIGLPIEFWCENSDTLFHHAHKNYHGFDEYDVYEELDYPDWTVPYERWMEERGRSETQRRHAVACPLDCGVRPHFSHNANSSGQERRP